MSRSTSQSKYTLYNQIVEYIRKKKKVKLTQVATRFGFSRHYFKYHVLKALRELYDDIKIVKVDGIEYVISEYEGEE